jgi:hypothetical protein
MTNLADMTKDELLELARDRNVEGRSSMTKDELIAALAALDPSLAGDPVAQEETTSESEREENARATAERENAVAELNAAGPVAPRRRSDGDPA